VATEGYCLLSCNAMYFGKGPKLRRNISPPFSGSRSEPRRNQQKQATTRSPETSELSRKHKCVTTKKTAFFVSKFLLSLRVLSSYRILLYYFVMQLVPDSWETGKSELM
jgi:hypothetical protein